VVYFTATSVTHTVLDSFLSDSAVFYRCINYSSTGISASGKATDGKLLVFPNPSAGTSTMLIPQGIEQLFILNGIGQILQKINVINEDRMEINLPGEGVYFIRASGMVSGVFSTSKLIVIPGHP
jgi:hypothetical protein